MTLLASGCSTIATLYGGAVPERFSCRDDYIPRIYSGVVNDFRYLIGSPESGAVIWDIPLSLVADTVVLPYTIYGQIRYGNLCNGKKEEVCKPGQPGCPDAKPPVVKL